MKTIFKKGYDRAENVLKDLENLKDDILNGLSDIMSSILKGKGDIYNKLEKLKERYLKMKIEFLQKILDASIPYVNHTLDKVENVIKGSIDLTENIINRAKKFEIHNETIEKLKNTQFEFQSMENQYEEFKINVTLNLQKALNELRELDPQSSIEKIQRRINKMSEYIKLAINQAFKFTSKILMNFQDLIKIGNETLSDLIDEDLKQKAAYVQKMVKEVSDSIHSIKNKIASIINNIYKK